MSTIDKGAASGPPPEPSVSTHGDPPAGQARFDAFISYRRIAEDMAFVDYLQEALAARGKNVWVDRAKIEPAADWSQRIAYGIAAAKAFIFVITPESVASEECLHELETAAQQHKLVIPVVLKHVTARGSLPEPLSRPNWIFFSRDREDARALGEVVQALEEDLPWRDAHTRLAVRTKEWMDAQRDRSFLLRGSDLRAAEEWMAQAPLHSKTPPTMQQTEYILASRKASVRTQRTWQGALSVGLVVALVLATFAFLQRQQAIRQRDAAVSRLLINDSEILADTDPVVSKLESVAAWRISPSDDARYAMLNAAARPGIRVEVLPAPGLPRFGLTSLASILNTVAFSPDAKIMAIGGFDGTVRLWNVATRQQIGGRLTGLTGRFNSVNSVAFSPDGKTVAAGSEDGRVWLWDEATRQQIGTPLAGDTGSVNSVAFSPDGKIMAAGSGDHTARLWDVATRQQIGTRLAGDASPVMSVTFSKDGKLLATGSKDGRAWLWDVATHQQIGTPLAGDTGSVDSVAFSLHGKLLATGSEDGTVRLWNVATHREFGTPLASNIGIVKSMAFSPDGRTLATGSGDHTTRLWDVINRQQIGTPLIGYTGPVTSVRFSPDGKTLATGSGDGTVRLWDVASVTGIATLVDPTGSILSVAFSPDGRTLATGGYDHTARLWDVATRQQIGDPLISGTGRVNSVAFSPDGKTLAVGSDDHTVRLWDVASRTVIATLTGHAGSVSSVAFSPDGKTLASGSEDGTVRLWDVATHHQIGSPLVGLVIGPGISPLGDLVESVAFSPDGKTVATVDIFGSVRLWDVATHRQIGSPLTSGVGWADTLAFSPDGKTLATGGVDDTVRLWDVASRTVKATLTGHVGSVTSVAFSPDGKTLASGGKDDTVRLWDVATHHQIGAPLTGYGRWVTSVAFSPDGMTLAGGSNDFTVRFWDTAYLTNTVAILCASVGRSFTHAEWARYAPGPAYQSICP